MNHKELPEQLDRKVICESDFVCLYADKVRLSNLVLLFAFEFYK